MRNRLIHGCLAVNLNIVWGNGRDYQRMKPVIGIHLLDFDLFTAPEQMQQAKPTGCTWQVHRDW